MDSRQRFVLVYASVAMVPFTVLTFLNTDDFGLAVSAYTIEYFALRLVLNPKMRLRFDVLGMALLVLFVYFLWLGVAGALGVGRP